MALAAPITISQTAQLIHAAVDEFAQTYGGKADIVSNLKELWNQASINSQSPRILIVYNGETSRGSFSQIAPWHRVDRSWLIAVTKGRGWYANRGDSLYNAEVQEMPLYDVVENVRDVVRFLQTISEETPMPDYRSTKPMQMGTMVIDGYLIEITTANDIPSNLTTQT